MPMTLATMDHSVHQVGRFDERREVVRLEWAAVKLTHRLGLQAI